MDKNLDLSLYFNEMPPKVDYVLPGLIAGSVGCIVSPGGAGKSMLALEISVLIASGADLLGLGPVPSGQVVYLSAEDKPIILHHRFYSIGKYLTPEQREIVIENLAVRSLTKRQPDLFNPEWRKWLIDIAQGKRLLIIDTLRCFHSGDENNSGQMAELIGFLKSASEETECSIVFLHHSNKASMLSGNGDQQHAIRGSTVLTDNVRWQAYLVGMTAKEAEKKKIPASERWRFVRLGLSKVNYGSPFEERWLERKDGGVLIASSNEDPNSIFD